ncbi:ABC transporter ATP-binding protein [Synechococcus sp. Cruz-9H2]|uniref:ABC transporter ATP-binding protein n=1 Tax=unclassified Synechococcus TaxID=2626047 RepID=UPI0020CF89A8|nr:MULTISPECIES: ABC transporter ATP-binding protein [unclassified Synechococcus]MCP9818843.1 ABC transporter ATP-binding protein [Synechococcus sp. Cruz-9H2]MCP9843346.1 ABC transporter ATP-binding protein [Synechococcus sp. Edmonson 11F2]MCP9855271.1 ABC transporter ATP-binding protein [Synechococcus sp. Cruz-9C9]MCP9862756.1 ABC transporter ATP-binding protein [Synechococcus sp. Cruz-7E5]MCP9869753.1 ABC transporter ATP-binding protein [Synechococcus sp. Cruz-7B9]
MATTPVASLIRHTARQEWRLLLVNMITTLLLAVTEAGSFAVIFQAAGLLAGAEPAGPPWLADLPRGTLFQLYLTAALGLQLLASGNRYVNGVTAGYFAARCQACITPEVHRHILRMSYACASRFNVGDLVHRATVSPLAVQLEIEQFGQICSNLMLALVYVATLAILSPALLVVAIGLGLAVAGLQRALRPRLRHASCALETERREVAAGITEDIQVLRLLHSSAATGHAERRMAQRMAGLEPPMRRLSRLLSIQEPVSDLLPLMAALLIVALSWQLFGGSTEALIPKLVTFVLALQRLNLRLIKTANNYNQLAENSGRIEQLDDLLQTRDKTFRRQGGLPFKGLKQGVRLEAVGLRFEARLENTLDDIDLSIAAGTTVALVGTSGAGKSSLVDLVAGLQDPTSGMVLVDGVDLRKINLDSWQRRLGVVTQDVLLLNASIRANIAFGLEEPSDAAIEAAARTAGAHDFIAALPQGYDTPIGERGYRLSGGQRQRLSLARAILRDPQILILDEATSALDSNSEALIHRSLQAFRNNRTVVTIAHRLASIMHADLIAVMEHGTIVERGSHLELLALNGKYASLWRLQKRGMAVRKAGPIP